MKPDSKRFGRTQMSPTNAVMDAAPSRRPKLNIDRQTELDEAWPNRVMR
jgi:hypothetical protein